MVFVCVSMETYKKLVLVLEYAPGVELFDAILSKTSFSEEEARPVFVQVKSDRENTTQRYRTTRSQLPSVRFHARGGVFIIFNHTKRSADCTSTVKLVPAPGSTV